MKFSSYCSLLIIIIFVIPFIPGTISKSSPDSSSSCVHPAQSARILPLVFLVPATISFLILFLIWLIFFRGRYRKWKMRSFEQMHSFSKNIPNNMQKIAYHGHYFDYASIKWTYLDKLLITYEDSIVILKGKNSKYKDYISEG